MVQGNHSVDLDFAKDCLSQHPAALAQLREQYTPSLRGMLISTGASESEAEDILASLWTDCTVDHSTRRPRLERYWGQCSLLTFLKTVCMNEFVDRRRRDGRWRRIVQDSSQDIYPTPDPASPATRSPSDLADDSLIAIMRSALLTAFDHCPPQQMVILQLVFIHGMTQRQVAKIWGCHEAKISRMLDSAMDQIAADTLRSIKLADPWLNIQWEDFLELCDGAGLSLFSENP